MNSERQAVVRRFPLLRELYRRGFLVAHRHLMRLGIPNLMGREFGDLRRVTRDFPPEHRSATTRPRVLFVIPRYWRTHAVFQVGIAQALTVRGARCAVATCGGVMPACLITWAERERVPPCGKCSAYVRDLAGLAGLEHFTLASSDDGQLPPDVAAEIGSLSLEQLLEYEFRRLPLGRYALPSARWRL